MWRYGALVVILFSTLGNTPKPESGDLELRRAVGAALRSLRIEHKPRRISQENLALDAGISRSYLGEIERGLHDPGLWTLWRLKTALKLSWGQFCRAIEAEYHPHPPNSGNARGKRGLKRD